MPVHAADRRIRRQRAMSGRREKLSAFVVSCNRAGIIGTCLRALRFADQLVVVDKSSTDGTREIAAEYADTVAVVPWSPTVEETRAHGLTLCVHDWILFLDDDECLSPGAVRFIQAELAKPRADIYALPLRHYILGQHDERAYYWPEHHVRLFRRGAVEFSPTVHAGIMHRSDRVMRVSPERGVCIHHLSHPDTAGWVERTNRYTSRRDRARVADDETDLARFAHARIDHWLTRTRDAAPDGYPAAVALLRAIYDMVDRLKSWEEARGLDGTALFRQVCAELDAAHAAEARRGRTWPHRFARARGLAQRLFAHFIGKRERGEERRAG
jgi:glycosyltransferase involved in cell wall biosynthesis